jgi:hypothetical protein
MAEIGRPTKMTPEVVTKLEEVFALDGTVEEACFYAGISRNAYYEWVKANPDLNDRFNDLRQRPFLKARQTIVKNLDQPEHAKWYMERKKKYEFTPRQEHTGADGKDLMPEPLTDEEKQALKSLIKSDTNN